MFESRALDRLTRVHPIVPPLIFIPAIAVTFALGQEGIAPLPVIAWLLAGYGIWSLTEYWLHRIVFHFEPRQGIGARLHWMIHGVHHDHPNDPMRLVMPPSASVPLALGFFWLFHLVLGGQHGRPRGLRVPGRLPGLRHDALLPAPPPGHGRGFGKLFYELHMRHHFQDDTRCFGVSVPYWTTCSAPPRAASAAADAGAPPHSP